MFRTDEEVRHRDGRLGVVAHVFKARNHNQCVMVKWPAGNSTVEREGALVHHTPVVEATEADVVALEARYGQTLDELVAEAERGYDVTHLG